MKAKILIGLLLLLAVIASIGIAVAHETDSNKPMDNMGSMEGMMGMGNGMDAMPMMNMMANMHREMTEEMGNMMNDEDFRNEMIEHMEDCPMIKQLNSE